MTPFEDGNSGKESPKKVFYRVPEGIDKFTDEQIDQFAENLYNQLIKDLGIEVTQPQNEKQDEGEEMSVKLPPAIKLTDRFFEAVRYATKWHENQSRKSTDIPYICHPLAAASLVIEAGGDEDQAIGALLHDIAEDCGGEPRLVEIREMFGERVSSIVRGCSDSLTESEDSKAIWSVRKEQHLSHLKDANMDVLIVTAADKLHNARAIATDLQTVGPDVWKRFNKDTNNSLIIKYYRDVSAILTEKEVTPKLLNPLASAIKIMEAR
jgi:(p)ppGpp synthase/HD superfamily hydrolase